MTKSLKLILLSIFYFLFSALYISPAWAQCGSEPAQIDCLEDYIRRLINFIYPLAAAVALFFLMWGGIKFIRSGGEPKAAEEAKKTMTYALAGLLVIFLIWFIFGVIEKMTGVDLTQFKIVGP